ncbi:MAG TPA: DUF5719 family protein [Ornithinicoccus sp.]|nr:DUF5719 family protein [Ornithinicoccus sp.]
MSRNDKRRPRAGAPADDDAKVDDFFYEGDPDTETEPGAEDSSDGETVEDFHREPRRHPEDDPAHPGHDPAAAARRRRKGAAARWARAAALAGAAALLAYAAGSGQVGTVDLAGALGKEAGADVAPAQAAAVAVVTGSTVVCPGPGQVGLADPTIPEPQQRVSISAGSAPVEVLPDVVDPSGAGEGTIAATPQGPTMPIGQRGTSRDLEIDGATWGRGTAQGALAAGFAASQLAVDLEEQQRGLSTTACLPPRDDTWLVAGGAEAGRVERLILVNPTGNPVTANVEVLGAAGPVEVVGGRGIVVAPAGREVVLLDALAPGEQRPVVHITTAGGPVMAALADRWLEGTLDRGLELTTATSAPATTLLIPAVQAPRPESADSVSIRVAVPGDEQAIVQLRALTATGPQRVTNDVTNVDAGAVADIDVSDLPEGTHAVEVVADTPVVAAAHVERRSDETSVADLAWLPAATPSTALLGAPLPLVGDSDAAGDAALGRQLSLASIDGAGAEVATVSDGKVATQQVDVPAAGAVTIDLEPDTDSVWVHIITGSASAAVATTLEDGQGVLVAGMPLPEAPVTRQVRSVTPWQP